VSERVKISSLKPGDRFAFRCELYELLSDVNGMAVCKNLETKRYMYTSLETEVTIEREEKTTAWFMKRFMRTE
jgi:hypothetical protein